MNPKVPCKSACLGFKGIWNQVSFCVPPDRLMLSLGAPLIPLPVASNLLGLVPPDKNYTLPMGCSLHPYDVVPTIACGKPPTILWFTIDSSKFICSRYHSALSVPLTVYCTSNSISLYGTTYPYIIVVTSVGSLCSGFHRS